MNSDTNVPSTEEKPLSSLVSPEQHKKWIGIKGSLYHILDTKLRETKEHSFMEKVISNCTFSQKNGLDAFATLVIFDLKTLETWTPEMWNRYFPVVHRKLKPLLLGFKGVTLSPDMHLFSSEFQDLLDKDTKEWLNRVKESIGNLPVRHLRHTGLEKFIEQLKKYDAIATLADQDLATRLHKSVRNAPTQQSVNSKFVNSKFEILVSSLSSINEIKKPKDQKTQQPTDSVIFYLPHEASYSHLDSYLGGIYISTGIESLEILSTHLFSMSTFGNSRQHSHYVVSLGQMYGAGKTALAKNWLRVVRLIYSHVEEEDFYRILRAMAKSDASIRDINVALRYCLCGGEENEKPAILRTNIPSDEQKFIEKMKKMLCGELVFVSCADVVSMSHLDNVLKEMQEYSQHKTDNWTFFSIDEFQTTKDILGFTKKNSFQAVSDFCQGVMNLPESTDVLIAGRGISGAAALSWDVSVESTLKPIHIYPFSLQHIDLILQYSHNSWNSVNVPWIQSQFGNLSSLLLFASNGVPLALEAVLNYFRDFGISPKPLKDAFGEHVGIFLNHIVEHIDRFRWFGSGQLARRLDVTFSPSFFSCLGLHLFCLMGSPQMPKLRERSISDWLESFSNKCNSDPVSNNFKSYVCDHLGMDSSLNSQFTLATVIERIPAYVTNVNDSLGMFIPPISKVEVGTLFQHDKFRDPLTFLSQCSGTKKCAGSRTADFFEGMVQSFFCSALIASDTLNGVFSEVFDAIPTQKKEDASAWKLMSEFKTPTKGFILEQITKAGGFGSPYRLSPFLVTAELPSKFQLDKFVEKSYEHTCLKVFEELRDGMKTGTLKKEEIPFFLLCIPMSHSSTADATILVSSGGRIVEMGLQMKWRMSSFSDTNYWAEYEKSRFLGYCKQYDDVQLLDPKKTKESLHLFIVVNPQVNSTHDIFYSKPEQRKLPLGSPQKSADSKKKTMDVQQLCLHLTNQNGGIEHVFGKRILSAFEYLQQLDPEAQNKSNVSQASQQMSAEHPGLSKKYMLLCTYLAQSPPTAKSVVYISSCGEGEQVALKDSRKRSHSSIEEHNESSLGEKRQKTNPKEEPTHTT